MTTKIIQLSGTMRQVGKFLSILAANRGDTTIGQLAESPDNFPDEILKAIMAVTPESEAEWLKPHWTK